VHLCRINRPVTSSYIRPTVSSMCRSRSFSPSTQLHHNLKRLYLDDDGYSTGSGLGLGSGLRLESGLGIGSGSFDTGLAPGTVLESSSGYRPRSSCKKFGCYSEDDYKPVTSSIVLVIILFVRVSFLLLLLLHKNISCKTRRIE